MAFESGKLEDVPSIDEEVALMQKPTEGDGEKATTAESPVPPKEVLTMIDMLANDYHRI